MVARPSFASTICAAGWQSCRQSTQLIRTTSSARRRLMRPLPDAKGQSISTTECEPGSLLAQWKLLRAATRDRRLSRGDIAVLFGVVDNYYRRHGNSRAAHSFLAAATGLSRRAVITSIKRLRGLGYLEVARIGSGTRPTEYVPNWRMHQNFTSASGEALITAEVPSTSLPEASDVNATSPKLAYGAGLLAVPRKPGPASSSLLVRQYELPTE